MTSKTQLQNKIQELEAELQSFKEELNNYKEVTLEDASVGDTLEDGSIVLKKENGLALLVAPKSTEVKCQWSKEFTEVFVKLNEQGFNPSQWFIPTQEQLELADNFIRLHFSDDMYWSSTEIDSETVWRKDFGTGGLISTFKERSSLARAFRCVTY
jgi:hypothetical protein